MNCWGEICCCGWCGCDDGDDSEELLLVADVKEEVEGAAIIDLPVVVVVGTTISS